MKKTFSMVQDQKNGMLKDIKGEEKQNRVLTAWPQTDFIILIQSLIDEF